MSDLAASGGYYIAMPAQVDRRAAGDADRLDRRLRRQDRHRRRAEQARRQPTRPSASGPNAEHRLAVRAVHAGAARRRCRRCMQSFYDDFVEKVAESRTDDAGEDRRRRAGPRLDRAAGERARPGRRARRPRYRGRASPSSARRFRRTRTSSWSSIPRRRLYEALTEQFGGGASLAWARSASRSDARAIAARRLRRRGCSGAASRWR